MPRLRRGNASIVILVVVLVFVVLGVVCCGLVGAAFVLPAVTQGRQIAQQMASTNNLKMIGLALHNYHDTYGAFPPAYTVDAAGQPLTSWRVLILPFINENDLYSQYDLSQPWDSPQNLPLASQTPAILTSPALQTQYNPGMTTYVALAAPNTLLNTQKSVSFPDITIGTSSVIAVVENSSNPVPWTQPIDLSPQQFLGLDFDINPPQGIPVVIGDGSVREFTEADRWQFQGMTSIDGS
ncbi:DUF1559 domain-containing protein [Blastopirellula marina]|uniref:DUF1559 domain-containing protein n=1 Tax=Blastopirellula marina TaxID=124 RepID=A0A2S8FHU7_9BACT|nr:DUF1559 domain-containing protein [Blastopirellula marina]PQO31748.1 hypothetical protein C5Y98_20260 [Blastopirellula marina]PTL43055.1 DUF1559 domain-containing protein [Blastopirellula marina]